MSTTISLISDVHLEWDHVDVDQIKTPKTDVLLVAGDLGGQLTEIEDFLAAKLDNHADVIYTPGNHEFYGSWVTERVDEFKELFDDYEHIHFLYNTSVGINDISFYGGTMWSDQFYSPSEPFATSSIPDKISDFDLIKYGMSAMNPFGKPITLRHVAYYHEEFLSGFDHWIKISEGKKRVCMSHFAPSKTCIHERFHNSTLNAYFYCNVEDRLLKTDVWAYGHLHDSFYRTMGDTLVVNNSYGSPMAKNSNFSSDLVIEL